MRCSPPNRGVAVPSTYLSWSGKQVRFLPIAIVIGVLIPDRGMLDERCQIGPRLAHYFPSVTFHQSLGTRLLPSPNVALAQCLDPTSGGAQTRERSDSTQSYACPSIFDTQVRCRQPPPLIEASQGHMAPNHYDSIIRQRK